MACVFQRQTDRYAADILQKRVITQHTH